MSGKTRGSTDPFTATEPVYIVRGETAPEVIARSLQRLLPTRHHPIARYRFTVPDTYDARVAPSGQLLGHADSVRVDVTAGGSARDAVR